MDKLKFLVVDDKSVIGNVFDLTLGVLGHQIKYVDDPRAVESILMKETFDLAFVDIIMPNCDGVDLLKDINSIAPDLPVVMMSGFDLSEKRQEAIALGAKGNLKKPFHTEDIKKVVNLVLGKDI